MSDIYESLDQKIEDFTQNLSTQENQVGLMVGINDGIAGIDIFDKPQTLKKLFPKLVRSYALDALEQSEIRTEPISDGLSTDFLHTILETPTKSFPAVGLGEDHRFEGQMVAGGALEVDGDIIHLSAFPSQDGAQSLDQVQNSRIVRSSRRRRYH
jgi:hypothetical protein